MYKGNILVLADKFPVSNGDKLKISIEKTNSEYIQGLSVDITGSCEMLGTVLKKSKRIKLRLWEDADGYDPKNIEITVFTKTGFVWVQNVWEWTAPYLVASSTGEPITKESKIRDSGHNGAAMIVEEIENGRRYRCNDGHPDENFDDIVFTIQKLKQ